MIKVIVPLAIVLVAGLVALVVVVLNRPRPAIPAADKRLLDDVAAHLTRMVNPTSLNDPDLLSQASKTFCQQWLDRYNRRHSK